MTRSSQNSKEESSLKEVENIKSNFVHGIELEGKFNNRRCDFQMKRDYGSLIEALGPYFKKRLL